MIVHIDKCPVCAKKHEFYLQQRSAALGKSRSKRVILTCPTKNVDFPADIGATAR